MTMKRKIRVKRPKPLLLRTAILRQHFSLNLVPILGLKRVLSRVRIVILTARIARKEKVSTRTPDANPMIISKKMTPPAVKRVVIALNGVASKDWANSKRGNPSPRWVMAL